MRAREGRSPGWDRAKVRELRRLSPRSYHGFVHCGVTQGCQGAGDSSCLLCRVAIEKRQDTLPVSSHGCGWDSGVQPESAAQRTGCLESTGLRAPRLPAPLSGSRTLVGHLCVARPVFLLCLGFWICRPRDRTICPWRVRAPSSLYPASRGGFQRSAYSYELALIDGWHKTRVNLTHNCKNSIQNSVLGTMVHE